MTAETEKTVETAVAPTAPAEPQSGVHYEPGREVYWTARDGKIHTARKGREGQEVDRREATLVHWVPRGEKDPPGGHVSIRPAKGVQVQSVIVSVTVTGEAVELIEGGRQFVVTTGYAEFLGVRIDVKCNGRFDVVDVAKYEVYRDSHRPDSVRISEKLAGISAEKLIAALEMKLTRKGAALLSSTLLRDDYVGELLERYLVKIEYRNPKAIRFHAVWARELRDSFRLALITYYTGMVTERRAKK
ncbi:MAG: hypothetical protein WCJ29_02630 [bacterium]